MDHLTTTTWLVLALGAAVAGFSKTAFGGVGPLATALFAAVLPARASTGIILPLLIAGDVLAVVVYRRHADGELLRRLLPWVGLGLVAGTAFLAVVDDRQMRVVIGAVLLVLVALQLVTRGERLEEALTREGSGGHRVAGPASGAVAGFTTMVANAAGPVMTLYLLLSGLSVRQFLGTSARFFLVVNLAKLPFSAGLGLLGAGSLRLDLALAPAVALGAGVGVLVVRRIEQRTFEVAALVLSAVAAGLLLV